MRTYYCDYGRCKFSGSRSAVRQHLREEHLIGKKNIQKKANWYYSVDNDTGNKRIYKKEEKE